MGTPYIGQIMLVPYTFAPRGFADCAGQLLAISQFQPLFSLIGTTYGGDGTTTFALPDLRSRVPVSQNSTWPLGSRQGEEGVSLQFDQIPAHTHAMNCMTAGATQTSPGGNMLAGQGSRAPMAYTPNNVATTDPDLNVMTLSGSSNPHENRQPYLGMRYVIATTPGLYPTGGNASYEIAEEAPEPQAEYAAESTGGDDAFIGQLSMLGFNFAPRNWAKCDGQLLAISGNPALFSLLGTTFGGDGVTTFALPDLRSRVPIGNGQGPGLSVYNVGQRGGVETVALTEDQNPPHNHQTVQGNAGATIADPTNALISAQAQIHSGSVANLPMANSTIGISGGQAHSNIQEFLTINFCIALDGIFPSRN